MCKFTLFWLLSNVATTRIMVLQLQYLHKMLQMSPKTSVQMWQAQCAFPCEDRRLDFGFVLKQHFQQLIG